MRISDWSSDVCSSDLPPRRVREQLALAAHKVDVLDIEDVLAEALGGELLQLQAVSRRRHVLDQLVGRVDPELRLRGPRRSTAAQPGQPLADQVLRSADARLGKAFVSPVHTRG